MRFLAVLGLLAILAGCGVPTGISAVSYVADGVSAGASGKSVNDHFISQVVNLDCGILRLFDGEWICRDRGIDPDDQTLYLTGDDGHEGPPRPWGTSREPGLYYDDGAPDDAREWASGTDLAFVDVGDDSSGEIVTAAHGSKGTYVGPAEIGDLSEARKANEDLGMAIDDEQNAEMSELGDNLDPGTLQQTPADGSQFSAPVTLEYSPDIVTETLDFGQSLGIRNTYESQSPVMIAALDDLSSQLRDDASGSAEEMERQLVMLAERRPTVDLGVERRPAEFGAHSANALGPATYGDASLSRGTAQVAAAAPVGVIDDGPREPQEIGDVTVTMGTPATTSASAATPRSGSDQSDERISGRLAMNQEVAVPMNAAATYLVVGSFRQRANAIRVVERRLRVKLAVVSSPANGKTYYRVIAGPFTNEKLAAARRALIADGFGDSWIITPCDAPVREAFECLSLLQIATLSGSGGDRAASVQVAGLRR